MRRFELPSDPELIAVLKSVFPPLPFYYRTYLMPRKADGSYSNMTDLELIYRCLGIILESIAFNGEHVDRGN